MTDLLNKINLAKGEKYGSKQIVLDKTAQDAIFRQDLIESEPILNKIKSLLNHVVNVNEDKSKYDEVALKDLLNACWKKDERKAYDAINNHQNWAKEATESLQKLSTLAQAKSIALQMFTNETAAINDTSLTSTSHIWDLMSALNYLKQTGATGTEKTRILASLKTIRDNSDKTVYNALKSRIDGAIISLEGSDKKNAKLENDWKEAQLHLDEVKRELADKDSEIERQVLKVADANMIHEEAKEKSENIKAAVEEIKNQKCIPESIIDRNKNFGKNSVESLNALVETNVVGGYFGGDRKNLGSRTLNTYVDKFISNILEEINVEKTIENIEKIDDSVLTNAQKKAALDSLREWAKLEEESKKRNFQKKFEESFKRLSNVEWKDRATLGSKKSDEFKAKAYADGNNPELFIEGRISRDKQFFYAVNFIINAFPRDKFKINNLLIPNDPLRLVKADGTDFQSFKIIWSGTSGKGEANKLIGTVKGKNKNSDSPFEIKEIKGIRPDGENPIEINLKLNNEEFSYTNFIIDLFGDSSANLVKAKRKITNFDGNEDFYSFDNWKIQEKLDVAGVNAYEASLYIDGIRNIINKKGLSFEGKIKETIYEFIIKCCQSYYGEIDSFVDNISKGNSRGSAWSALKGFEEAAKSLNIILLEEEREVAKKEAIAQAEKEELKELNNERKQIAAKVRDAEKLERTKKDLWENTCGLSLDKLKSRFKNIYGSGPDSSKYEFERIQEMSYILGLIRDKSNNALDTEFLSYEEKLDQLDKKIKAIPDLIQMQAWLSSKGSVKNKVDKINFDSDDEKRNYVNRIKQAIKEMESLRLLKEEEKEALSQINDYLAGRKQEEKKTTDLDLSILQTILSVSDLSETDIKLEDWKKSTNYNTQIDLESFVKDYRPSGIKATEFKLFLAKGEIDSKKFDGTDYWTKFIKEGPVTVIKNLLYFACYEQADENGKKAIIDRIKNAHSNYGGDKPNASQIAQFLYDEKESTVAKKETTTETGGKLKSIIDHLKNNWHWYALTVIGVSVVLAFAFWDKIKEWWNKGEEEEGTPEQEKIQEIKK